MNKLPYIEPTIRTIAGALVTICGVVVIAAPDYAAVALGLLLFVGVNLFQSSFTRFCLMEKLLKRLGFRSEMDEIRRMALHDALTDLPNRALLEDRMDMALSLARRTQHKVAVLFIDLDSFKQVNDLNGHKAGDRLLVDLSQRLRAHLRRHDTLARWGGDEFVVVLPEMDTLDHACEVAEKIKYEVQRELTQQAHPNVTLSVGMAVFPDDGDTSEILLVQADKALYHAKMQGRNNIQVYSRLRDNGHGFVDFERTARFADAVNQRRIEVHYQPIVDARHGRIVAVEALARWRDEKGWVSPGLFIPLAENIGLIHEVGHQVLDKALHDFRTVCEPQQLRLAVNISNRQLFSRTFAADLDALRRAHGLAPDRVKLEITESIALDTNNAQQTLKQLADAGYYLSLDDFGTGFSSLSRLHELPVRELKIDLLFVRRARTPEGIVMLKTIVNMAQDMRLIVVAEGVEDEETANILRDLGVEYLQGYLFGRPMSRDDLVRHVRGDSPISATGVTVAG